MSHLAWFPLLETIPGWPEVTEPALIESLGVLLLWPAAIAALFTLLLMGPQWFRASQAVGSEVEPRR